MSILTSVSTGWVVGGGLTGCGVDGDGEVSCMLCGYFGGSWEAEDVGGFVLAAIGAVEALEFGVGGEEYVYFTFETDRNSGAVEEAREGGLRQRGDGRGTWRVDGNHR
jgi:hypothetical protein